jgi:hypothetical protein
LFYTVLEEAEGKKRKAESLLTSERFFKIYEPTAADISF